jgi:hypothetical protein
VRIVESVIRTEPDPCENDTHCVYSLGYQEGSGNFALLRDGEPLYAGARVDEICRVLISDLITTLVSPYNAGLALHAAAVGGDGNAVVIPGASGAGKSTLAAWLVSRGNCYLTDEVVIIDMTTYEVAGFFRPLHIKAPALQAVYSLIEERAPSDRSQQTNAQENDAVTLIEPERIAPQSTRGDYRARVMLFPEYSTDKNYQLASMSPAQCAHRLMGALINARNLPNKGLDAVSNLARSIPGYQLRYGHFSELADLQALLEQYVETPAHAQ